MLKISVVIPTHNGAKHILETIDSALAQDYPNLEIVISENASTDNTLELIQHLDYPNLVVHTTPKDLTCGGNYTKLMEVATGDILVYICDDDVFLHCHVIRDIALLFRNPEIGVVGRNYYQFIDNPHKAIRKNNSKNIYQSADNISGMAFRKKAMTGEFLNKPFVEAASMVANILKGDWDYSIHPYFTTGIRIGNNGSMTKPAYVTSPTMNWLTTIGKEEFILKNYEGFIQLKNYAGYKALLIEICIFIKFRPKNLYSFKFWFFVLGALLTPAFILKPLVNWYKRHIL